MTAEGVAQLRKKSDTAELEFLKAVDRVQEWKKRESEAFEDFSDARQAYLNAAIELITGGGQ